MPDHQGIVVLLRWIADRLQHLEQAAIGQACEEIVVRGPALAWIVKDGIPNPDNGDDRRGTDWIHPKACLEAQIARQGR